MAISHRAFETLLIIKAFKLTHVTPPIKKGSKLMPWAILRKFEDPQNMWGTISEKTITPLIRNGYIGKIANIRPGMEHYGLTELGEDILNQLIKERLS